MAAVDHDSAIFDTIRTRLSVAAVSDVLDSLGYQSQVLPPAITPVSSHITVLVGRAMPIQVADSVLDDSPQGNGRGPIKDMFGIMIDALDSLREGEVCVATGATEPYAVWGELFSTRAIASKANGVVINGYARDLAGVEKLGFPVFATGVYGRALGVRGKVIDYRCAVRIGNVHVNPGDLVFGDRDGVVIIPKEVEAKVIEESVKKVEAETKIAELMRQGKSAKQSLAEVLGS